MYRLGWFSTGRDEAASTLLRSTLERIQEGYIPDTEIKFVFSNRKPSESRLSDQFLSMVEGYGIDVISISHRSFRPELRKKGLRNSRILGYDSPEIEEWRMKFDKEITDSMGDYRVDLNVLAGYMLILSKEMCHRYRIINLHPSPPGGPKGSWQEVMWQMIEGHSQKGGAMVHIVTEELDRGPPVTYCTFPLRGPLFDDLWAEFDGRRIACSFPEIVKADGESNRLFKMIRHEEEKREAPLLIETIKGFAEARFKIEDHHALSGGSRIKGGICLNERVREYMRRFN